MKKYLLLIILPIILLLFTGCQSQNRSSRQTAQESSSSQSREVTEQPAFSKTTVPIVFFHGYQGTANSFGKMIQRLETDQFGEKELTMIVQPDGIITAEGELSGAANNPFVQVLFADNQNNEWNQAEWVQAVLVYLKDQFAVTQVNIIGHSMGGVSSLRFLITYGDDNSIPQVNKLVALGSPFNEFIDSAETQTLEEVLAAGPAVFSPRYVDYQNGVSNLSKQTEFLLIGGKKTADDPTDGMIPLTSALAVHSLLVTNGNEVADAVIENSDHSGLHENLKVDELIKKFLTK